MKTEVVKKTCRRIKDIVMGRAIFILFIFLFFSYVLVSSPSFATNGNNLLGIGPISRAMGGVGVADPQDAISAVFANPATLCFADYCPGSASEFATTIFDSSLSTRISIEGPRGERVFETESKSDAFIIPAIGISTPLGSRFRFALGAFGVQGMGADYRNSGLDLDSTPGNGNEGDIFTQLEVVKISPNLAWLVSDDFSVGFSFQVISGNLDLGSGGSRGYATGIQFGALYKWDPFKVGISYITPQKVEHERVADFDRDGVLDSLDLESPQNVTLGIAFSPSDKLLIETDLRWFNWEDAEGYGDFDWEDQWVFALGAQYQIFPGWYFRLGYNYGENPVRENNGWNPAAPRNVQGKTISAMQFELLRVVGFPAVSEHHFTVGIGYHLSDRFIMNFAYMHGFESTIREQAADNAVGLTSELTENTHSLGLTWRF